MKLGVCRESTNEKESTDMTMVDMLNRGYERLHRTGGDIEAPLERPDAVVRSFPMGNVISELNQNTICFEL